MTDESGKQPEAAARPQVSWDDSAMVTQFANVVNVQGTQEQVDIFLGTNRTWNPAQAGEVVVTLNNRVILTPLAAKRLWTVLGGVLAEHENRFGPLKIE